MQSVLTSIEVNKKKVTHSEPTSVQGSNQPPVETSAPLQFLIDLVRGHKSFLGETNEASPPNSLPIISSPVCTATGLAEGGKPKMSKALSPEMGPKGKVL